MRTAEAYLRGRQNPDGLWYPGGPPKPGTAREAPPAKDREAARWLTVRVLVVLRRVNYNDPTERRPASPAGTSTGGAGPFEGPELVLKIPRP